VGHRASPSRRKIIRKAEQVLENTERHGVDGCWTRGKLWFDALHNET
jgi:hypothetical protein